MVADDAAACSRPGPAARAGRRVSLGPIAAGAQPLEQSRDRRACGHTLRVLAPLSYQGRTVGAILTELDVADLVAERRRAALWLLPGNAAGHAGAVAGGCLLMRRCCARSRCWPSTWTMAAAPPTRSPQRDIPKGETRWRGCSAPTTRWPGAVEARADAERRLAERERFVSLGRLASSLAHEIDNPLGGLLNAADTSEPYADRPDVVRAVGRR